MSWGRSCRPNDSCAALHCRPVTMSSSCTGRAPSSHLPRTAARLALQRLLTWVHIWASDTCDLLHSSNFPCMLSNVSTT